jgi:hypothetical protein
MSFSPQISTFGWGVPFTTAVTGLIPDIRSHLKALLSRLPFRVVSYQGLQCPQSSPPLVCHWFAVEKMDMFADWLPNLEELNNPCLLDYHFEFVPLGNLVIQDYLTVDKEQLQQDILVLVESLPLYTPSIRTSSLPVRNFTCSNYTDPPVWEKSHNPTGEPDVVSFVSNLLSTQGSLILLFELYDYHQDYYFVSKVCWSGGGFVPQTQHHGG